MQEKYDLLHKVLKQFHDAGVLDEIILIGSWCLHFYKKYFTGKNFVPSIRTRDIDFLVPIPVKSRRKVDIAGLLKNEGFIVTFNKRGYIRLEHPELIIEFLVPERGRGTDKPYPLPYLGVNAQALRFLDFLARNTISIESDGINLRVPHPAAFGLHKLIVSQRRKSEEKMLKEWKEAIDVLNTLIAEAESIKIKETFDSMPVKWRRKVLDVLEESGNKQIIDILK